MSARAGGGTKWFALQGLVDQVCTPSQTVSFVGKVPHAEVVSLEKVGHGFSVPSRWGSAFDRSVSELLEPRSVFDPDETGVHQDADQTSPQDIGAKLQELQLPLEVLWPPAARSVVIFVSGDGGWADLDRGVAKRLAAHGVAVVGWNALRYFWQGKTPQRFADDLSRLIRVLPPEDVIFAGGYSFGAEIVPVVAATGSHDPALSRIVGLTLLGPGKFATFEVSPLDWIRRSTTTDHPVRPAIESAGLPVLCVAPDGETDSGCPAGTRPGYTRAVLPGGHHFGSDYDGLAARVMTFVTANSPH
jgi:type IV secretory pathway VirJ component